MASAISQADSAAPHSKPIVAVVLRYGLAVAAVAAALALTLVIRRTTGSPTFFLFYIAIFVSIWFAGRGPGWLALILASLVSHYWLFGSPVSMALFRGEVPTLVAFVLCAVVADLLSTQRRQAENALREAGRRAELTVQERTAELKRANKELLVEIAERKRAEASLRASEEWWRTIFEASNTPMAVTDLTGRHIVVNAAAERVLGYTNEELRNISIQELTHEDDRARTVPIFNELSEGRRQYYHVEKRYRCKDGSVKWLKASVTRVPDPKGGPDLTASVVEDITERKRAEASVRASEERWRRVFESSAIPMALADGERRIVAANPACERLLGYTQEEFLAMSALDFKYGDDRDVSARMLQELEQGRRREFQGELRFRRKDGTPIWVNVSVSYVPATEITPALFPAVIEDVTQRKQAELERQRLASVVEQAGDFMGIADLDGTPIYLNEAGRRMVGLDAEQFSARRGTHYLFREDRPFMNQVVWRDVMKNGSWSGELRFRHFKTGEAIPILYDAFRIDDAETGRPANIGYVCRDITERKRAEDALRQAQAELARVARVTTVGELGASIAHEINQPLAAIVASGSACQRWLDSGQNLARAKESLNRMISDANRASDVIKRIRSLTNRKAPEQLELDINAVVDDVLTFTRGELHAKNISIRRELSPDVPAIMGDRVQLQQVILNLVMNGIDAMATITDRPRVLTVKSQIDADDGVLVTVVDSGTGLDPQNAERVFDAFFTTKPEGMGMGLSISTSIVEAHGGRLWASAAQPHGTAFHFTLPPPGGSRS